MTARQRQVVRHLGIYAGLTPFLLITLFPLVWMTITAFKHERDLYQMEFPLWFHLPPTLKHFRLLFTQTWFGTWVLNTAMVSLAVVAITLVTAVPAAYALARRRLRAANGTGVALFMTYLIPPIVLFIPLAPVVAALGLMDSRWALVLLYPTMTIPFCTWLMMGFFPRGPARGGGGGVDRWMRRHGRARAGGAAPSRSSSTASSTVSPGVLDTRGRGAPSRA
jgi:multiple sugar transport system permease protein